MNPALPHAGVLALPATVLPVLLGAGIAVNPQLAFLAALAILGVAGLAAPASVWVLAALVATMTFKGLTTLGLLPSVAAFVDIPLAWSALLVALLNGRQWSPFVRSQLRWLLVLAVAVMLAAAFNGSQVLRPILYLALLGTPFAIVGALVADPPSARMRSALEWSLLALVLVQIPFAALQLVTLGPADDITGTLYGASAGPHVVSAVIVVGAIWILVGGRRQGLGLFRLPLVALLITIPFVADAKQVIVALPAIAIAATWRAGRLAFVARAALVIAAVVTLFAFVPAGRQAATFIDQNRSGEGGKQATASLVWAKLREDPVSLAVGKGPAETVSRAAFMTTSVLQKEDTPIKSLGLEPAVIAEEAWAAVTHAPQLETSLNSGVSSMLGVLGDLGVIGFAAYAGLLVSLFVGLRSETSAEGIAAASGFAMFIVLGLVFDWWEQPPFGIVLGVLAGLSLSATRSGPPAPAA
jgi:hypothetical protein